MPKINFIITDKLFGLKDEQYREFYSKLIPDVLKSKIIGVRVPLLRKLAKEYYKIPESESFLRNLPHEYYEENNIHAFLIEQIKDIHIALEYTEKFLPYIDNWSTCDMFSPKIFKNHLEIIESKALEWLESDNTYTVRYGIVTLMRLFLDDKFDKKYPKKILSINSSKYYVEMAIAWYFATALAKQYDSIIEYFETPVLDKWVHNKALQKARESLVIPKNVKDYLNTLKVK